MIEAQERWAAQAPMDVYRRQHIGRRKSKPFVWLQLHFTRPPMPPLARWRPSRGDVVAAMLALGLTGTQVARALGVTRQAVSLHRRRVA